MPLHVPPNALGKTQTNLTAADRDGTTITTSGTAHVKGAFSAGQLIASTDEDTYGITVAVTGVSVATAANTYLLDIGIGASGSEEVLIQDLNCCGADTSATSHCGARNYYFPVFIAKGTRVAARGQALVVSDVANVAIWLHQACDGYGMEVPNMWERLGTVTTSRGVSVTPGSGAFGSWTTILDPITKNYRWWHVGFDSLGDTSVGVGEALVEIGIGDTSAAVSTIGSWVHNTDTNESIKGPHPALPVFQPVFDDDAKGVFARIASFEVEARGVLVYAGE